MHGNRKTHPLSYDIEVKRADHGTVARFKYLGAWINVCGYIH